MTVMIDCRTCHDHRKHHAHGLCNKCYARWFKTKVQLPAIDWSPYCRCEHPVPERLHLWNTWQCGTCGKSFDDR